MNINNNFDNIFYYNRTKDNNNIIINNKDNKINNKDNKIINNNYVVPNENIKYKYGVKETFSDNSDSSDIWWIIDYFRSSYLFR